MGGGKVDPSLLSSTTDITGTHLILGEFRSSLSLASWTSSVATVSGEAAREVRRFARSG
jgi:hypothetical protein